MNEKNLLQELCQKNGYHFPKYTSYKIGLDHEPKWQATVFVNDQTFYGDSGYNSKTDAEKSAAKNALSKLEEDNTLSNKQNLEDNTLSNNQNLEDDFCKTKILEDNTLSNKQNLRNSKIAIIIDYENLPGMVKIASNLVGKNDNIKIYAFIGVYHHASENILPINVKKMLVYSSRSDAVDTCIQVYTGSWLSEDKFEEYFIVTRDHFGSALVDMITTNAYEWPSAVASVITNETMLKEYLCE